LFNTINFLEKSLEFRKIRQDLIASNIANADTPYYRPRDIRFEEALENEIKKILLKNCLLQKQVQCI